MIGLLFVCSGVSSCYRPLRLAHCVPLSTLYEGTGLTLGLCRGHRGTESSRASCCVCSHQASTELLESSALAEAVAVAEHTNRPSSMLPARLRVPQLRRLQHLRRLCPERTLCEDMDETVQVLCDYTLVEADATL
jgi:hypothetical protein